MDTRETNNLTSAIIETMNIVSKANASTSTLTIEARIKEVVDAGLGIYKVAYMENVFEASSAYINDTYDIDELVYILIPNGNFDKNKVIISRADKNRNAQTGSKEENVYIALGDSLIEALADVNLCSYIPSQISTTTLINSSLVASINDSYVYCLNCDIATNIPKEQRVKGNYGITFEFPLIQDNQEIIYPITLDVSNIKGDPYGFDVYTNQKYYFHIPENAIFDSNRDITIKYFVTDFLLQQSGMPTDIHFKNVEIISAWEIAKDNMQGYHAYLIPSNGSTFLDETEKTLIPILYYNGKKTDLKNYDCYWFKQNNKINSSSEKYHQLGGVGWEILNEKKDTFSAAGGSSGTQYVTNVYEYKVESRVIFMDTIYKCVLANSKNTSSATVTIRVQSPINIELFSDSESNTYITEVGNYANITFRYTPNTVVADTDTLCIRRVIKDRLNNIIGDIITEPLIKISGLVTTYENHFSIPVNLIDNRIVIQCALFNKVISDNMVKEIEMGIKELTLYSQDSSPFNIYLENDDRMFNYDAEGNSPCSYNYNGPVTSIIKNIPPITITKLTKNFTSGDTDFSDAEYLATRVEWLFPRTDTMLKNLYTSTGEIVVTERGEYIVISGSYNSLKSLSYGIQDTFDDKKQNNNIMLYVYFKNEVVSRSIHSINFSKDGQVGTNGSKYSAIITYEGVPYCGLEDNGIESKWQVIYAADVDKWYTYNPAKGNLLAVYGDYILRNNYSTPTTPFVLQAQLYSDGERVTTLTSNDIEWSIFDDDHRYDNISSPIRIKSNGQMYFLDNIKWEDPDYNFTAIVRAKIRAKKDNLDNSLTDSEEYVFAYYPIETMRVEKYSYLEDMFPCMIGGFSQVTYASDGCNPQYDSNNNFIFTNTKDRIDTTPFYDFEWKGSGVIRTVTVQQDESCKVTPATKYDNGVAKNYLKVAVLPKDNVDNIKTAKVNSITFDLQDLENQLSYYTYMKKAISIFNDNTFNYDNSVAIVSNSSSLFDIKSKLLTTEENMLAMLNNIKNNDLDDEEDPVIQDLIDKIDNMINSINNLIEKTKLLCFDSAGSAYMSSSVAEHTNFIINILNGDYLIINEDLRIYNALVQTTYKTYQEQVNSTFISNESAILALVSSLFTFAEDNRWAILSGTYPDVEDEEEEGDNDGV